MTNEQAARYPLGKLPPKDRLAGAAYVGPLVEYLTNFTGPPAL
jgi:hypothetical protein